MGNFKQLPELFEQLGLPSSESEITAFIKQHRLAPEVKLPDAPFWNASQADFLRSAFEEDSDWSQVMDELNRLLHV